MKKIREVIVVEGRYDKNTLSQVVDAVIVETGGFSVFHNKEKIDYLRHLARERGLILMTDPDGAGFVIRNYLKGSIPPEQIKQAYVPDIRGKRAPQAAPPEKRASSASRVCARKCCSRRCAARARHLRRCAAGGAHGEEITRADLLTAA